MSLKVTKIMFMFSRDMTYTPPQRKREAIFENPGLDHPADLHHPTCERLSVIHIEEITVNVFVIKFYRHDELLVLRMIL